MLRLVFSALILMVMAGCSTNQSMRSTDPGGRSQMFPLSAATADKILGEAMMEEFPGGAISRVDLPNKGYSVTHRFALDSQTFVAYMVPATGVSPGGERVDGFYFEVTSNGTMPISGQTFSKNIYDRLIRKASAAAAPLPLAQ